MRSFYSEKSRATMQQLEHENGFVCCSKSRTEGRLLGSSALSSSTEPRESLRLEQELMSCHHSNITPSPQKRLQMPAGCCKPSLSSTYSSVIIPDINRCQELPWVVQEWEFPAGRENGT